MLKWFAGNGRSTQQVAPFPSQLLLAPFAEYGETGSEL
jgi:hypothetical protein